MLKEMYVDFFMILLPIVLCIFVPKIIPMRYLLFIVFLFSFQRLSIHVSIQQHSHKEQL
jgi:hypothetical protein